MSKKQKLELTWIGKDKRPRLEPRILLEDKTLSYRADNPITSAQAEIPFDEQDNTSPKFSYNNLLIHGDNLLALKALEQQYAGKVKCVFIDPPYNTGSAFTHYDDGVEHSLWLSLMRDRLEAIRTLLAEDGSLWITIDDNEAHYLKVLCDEVFGRVNFITSIVWQKIYTTKNTAKHFSGMHDYVLVYSKNSEKWQRNDLPRTAKQDDAYKNPDNDARGPWKATPIQARNYYSKGLYPITSPSGRVIDGPPKGTYWRISEGKFMELQSDNRIWWGIKGDNIPAQKRFLIDVQGGVVPSTWWPHDEAGHNAEAKNEIRAIAEDVDELFITPKPERLIKRILEVSTNPGDLVLDSFAGSGTTGAVAQKMGRRWIMVELGDHCQTHIVPRLKKVITGEDQGGISKAVNWQGGGGFRYFRLAPSLLKKDTWGNWIINKAYNAEMLSEAMCKHMGYIYAPSQEIFWQHGYATENSYIYVTTGTLGHDQLKLISSEIGTGRSLLICCKGFMANVDEFPNLSIKKIPQAVLHKCEWDHDDYSFAINVLPDEQDAEGGENE